MSSFALAWRSHTRQTRAMTVVAHFPICHSGESSAVTGPGVDVSADGCFVRGEADIGYDGSGADGEGRVCLGVCVAGRACHVVVAVPTIVSVWITTRVLVYARRHAISVIFRRAKGYVLPSWIRDVMVVGWGF